jgi:hypothetical protein
MSTIVRFREVPCWKVHADLWHDLHVIPIFTDLAEQVLFVRHRKTKRLTCDNVWWWRFSLRVVIDFVTDSSCRIRDGFSGSAQTSSGCDRGEWTLHSLIDICLRCRVSSSCMLEAGAYPIWPDSMMRTSQIVELRASWAQLPVLCALFGVENVVVDIARLSVVGIWYETELSIQESPWSHYS